MAPTAHLVGSMAFATSDAAMRAVGEVAGTVVQWVPDGEPGKRRKWMTQHKERFSAIEGLEVHSTSADRLSGRPNVGLKAGVRPDDVHIDTFGYAQAARESYELFADLKQQGVLAPDARFQVSVPPPMGALSSFVAPEDRDALEPVIERAFLADLAAIEKVIPHDELAIQWDVAVEIAILEGMMPTHLDDPFSGVVERLVRIGDAVSDDVTLAYHFCYGSPYDIHVKEPEDTALMVRLSNALIDGLHRHLDRLHMPVPINRDDAAYFAPLVDLRLDGAQLFLGLLHYEDGLEGTRRRIAAAKRCIGNFGVATECGTGRTVAEPVGLLRLHALAARLADQPLDESIEVPEHPRPRPPVDPEQVNADLRAFAQQRGCAECGAPTGESCRSEDNNIATRPHMDRYHEALLAHVGQEAAKS